MTFLSDRFFLLLGAALVVTVGTLVFPIAFTAVVLLWPVLAVLALFDLQSLPKAKELSGSVRFPQMPELGTEVILEVAIRYQARRTRLVRIEAKAPDLVRVKFSASLFSLRRKPDDAGVIEGTLQGTIEKLGHEEISEIVLVCRSLGDLWIRHVKLAVPPVAFRAIPTLAEPSEQSFREIVSSQRLLFQGSRRQMRSRSAELFHSVRKYQSSDSIRHLDHRKIAKYGELMTRVFDSFYDHHLILGLDLGRSLMGDIRGSLKYDYYLAANLVLARNALKARDRVSFFCFSQNVHHMVRAARHQQSFFPLFRGDKDFRPREEESNFDLVPQTIHSLSGQRSIVLLFTDPERPSVQSSLRRILPALSSKHLVVIVGLNDETYGVETQIRSLSGQPFEREHYSRLLYGMWLNDRLRLFQEEAAARGVGVLSIGQGHWLGVVNRLYGLLRDSMAI